jgi:5-formyltetrahydrofolate cyclo-ligase
MDAVKSAHRAGLQSALRATTPAARMAWSAEIRRLLMLSDLWTGARTVMLFAAMRFEPDLVPLTASASAKRLVFPSLENDMIVPRLVTSPDEFIATPHGIREPDQSRCPAAGATGIDLVLVPGLGFSKNGTRLGRGRGHYDRFLASLPPRAVRCGVCFSCQLVPDLPAEPHDVSMSWMLSEEGVFATGC